MSEPIQTLLDEKNLAEHLRVSVRTLQAQRQRGDGIPFIRVGRAVRYDLTVVQEYLARNSCTSTIVAA